MNHPSTVVITGSSGLLGSSLIHRLGDHYNVVGFDRAGPPYPPIEAECVSADMTDRASVARALQRVRHAYGDRIAGVIHLAAYYDFSGGESDLYQRLTVDGTRMLLDELKGFDVGVFAFSSTMLVHRPCEPGQRIDENWPLDGKWDYPASKIAAERVIREHPSTFPRLALRIAGVYDDFCHSIPIANQIQRIDAGELTSRVYPGDTSRGQAFVHLDDAVESLALCVERREGLQGFIPLLIGEDETLSYDELQRTISRRLGGDEIDTVEIPKVVARVGARLQDHIPFTEDPFIKPWMIDLADDHYALDISRAREVLGWVPKRTLRETLPGMIAGLISNPEAWYAENGVHMPANAQSAKNRSSRPGRPAQATR